MDRAGFQFDADHPVCQHDAEEEQHEDAADIDQHLGYGEEIRLEEDVESGDPEKGEQERERRIDDVF